ncbi:hypothetical protein DFH06DRAFT_1151642 [Mycena polygramma]|nr:hypothetical protein DFH06DRAFT_1151642 [Mycena polygramma]
MSQSESNDVSLVSAAPPSAAATTKTSSFDLSPPTMPIVAIDISDLASDSYSVADYDSDVSGDLHEGDEAKSASTEAAEAAEAPKALSLAEAFELLSMGAAAVSQAAAAAAAAAARQDAAAAAAAAAAASAAAAPAPVVPGVPAFVQSTGPWVVGSLFNVIPAAHLTGIDEIADKWYAITKGTYVGITKHNNLSSNATIGVSGSQQNGFTLQSEAITAFNTALDGGMSRVAQNSDAVLGPNAVYESRSKIVIRSRQVPYSDSPLSRSPSPASSLSSSSPSTEYFSDDGSEPRTPPCSPPSPPRTPSRPNATEQSAPPSPSPSRLSHSRGAHGLTQDRPEVALPATTAQLSSPSPRKRGAKSRAYAVFFGRVPGWAEADSQVSGARGSLFQSYPSEAAARAAYMHAEARSWTGVCSSSLPYEGISERQRPAPAALTQSLSPLHCGTWYVVYKGIQPGVYQSFLECGLNTAGISGSRHDSFTDKRAAFASFADAEAGGSISCLAVPHV